MEIFSNLEDFVRITSGTAKWDRAAQAISLAPHHAEGVMHSIGDSLTYLRTRRRHDTALFTGHRRYLEVVAAGEGEVELEIAPASALVAHGDYDDTTDREHFDGAGTTLRLAPREICVLAIDEALRYPAAGAAEPFTVLHVSVEGATFHNK